MVDLRFIGTVRSRKRRLTQGGTRTSWDSRELLFLSKLALKHRQGKNHKMRIIAFVGSPVEDNEKDVSPQAACQAEPPFGSVLKYLELARGVRHVIWGKVDV